MTDNSPANAGIKLFRSFCATIDAGVYTLLGFMYEIFFNIASADLFANETILGFYKRVQLIIGVYMVFQLAILIMKGIFNTDTVSGKNNNEFVKKIIIALVMLTVITPISIPNAQNEYEKQINNNGLLFGTLYSLQYRILNNNTIGRLVLGTDDSMTATTNNSRRRNSSSTGNLTQSANVFTTTILKGFFRINLVDKDKRVAAEAGKALETKNKNRMCQDIDKYTIKLYAANDTSPGDLLSLVNATCTPDTNAVSGPLYEVLTFWGISSKSRFVFAYMPFISTIVGIVFIVIMISFCIDIAIRAIKLAVLRLIAPIPIISYMDPNGSKDSGFNSWIKTLTQTYLDLFIRLASVYFVVYLIQDMIANGLYMNTTFDAVGVISFIFICIGLFLFAKEAPKFLQQAIGMKNEPMNLFGRALATGGALLGTVGSGVTNYRAAKKENEILHPEDEGGLNVFRNAASAIVGGIAGAGVGLSSAYGKDGNWQKVREAQNARNAARDAHKTLWGGMADTLYGSVTGSSLADTGNRRLEATSKASELIGKLKSATEEEGIKNGAAITRLRDGSSITIGGVQLDSFDGDTWEKAMANATDGIVSYLGKQIEVDKINDLEVEEARKSQVQAWMSGGGTKTGGKTYAQMSSGTEKLASIRTDLQNQLSDAAEAVAAAFNVGDFGTYGKAIGVANKYVSDTKAGATPEGMRQAMRNANSKKRN